MSGLHFARPSVWRVFWSVVAAVFVVYVVTVVVVYVVAVTTRGGPLSESSNGYIGFLMWDLLFAGPIYVLTFWFITLPAVFVLGGLMASLRRSRCEVEPATGPI
ncbi:hypothetical protein QRB41_28250 [Mycobacterium avium subsp. hominissuis]|uniref:hypothetical protein n=1 Tax=Mycobacterium avium TaxID=1764 RepID=UPI002666E4B4|nr:hypothetical protein [Mycobacterium avium]MDO2387184.1 hypothetical protein [Mycobacterium avium subsp. hominissuis]